MYEIFESNKFCLVKGRVNLWGFPGSSDGKEPARNERDTGLVPGSGRFPGEGSGNPLQYSCLENPMEGGTW